MSTQILIIEDVAEIRENIADLLSIHGYEASTASDGGEGILKAKLNPPNLIVCDIMMGKLDGYQVLETIRNMPELAHIPFIFLTAKTEMMDLRQGMDLGADDYLTKPFVIRNLITAIESRLKRGQQQQENQEEPADFLKTIYGRDGKGRMLLQTDDCVYFFRQGRGNFVQHPMGIYQVDISLDKLSTELKSQHFFRVNRNVIIHRKCIQKYSYWDKGKYCLFLMIGDQAREVTLPKARFRDFRTWLSV